MFLDDEDIIYTVASPFKVTTISSVNSTEKHECECYIFIEMYMIFT